MTAKVLFSGLNDQGPSGLMDHRRDSRGNTRSGPHFQHLVNGVKSGRSELRSERRVVIAAGGSPKLCRQGGGRRRLIPGCPSAIRIRPPWWEPQSASGSGLRFRRYVDRRRASGRRHQQLQCGHGRADAFRFGEPGRLSSSADSVTFASRHLFEPKSAARSPGRSPMASIRPLGQTSSVAVSVSNPDLDIMLQNRNGPLALWQASGATPPTSRLPARP